MPPPLLDSAGFWRPNTSLKQDELRALCRFKRFVLANGPRYSGKSMGSLACIAEHAWLTEPCNISMITISQTVGMDSGIWKDFVNHTLPEWIGHHPDGREWVGRDQFGNEIGGGNFGMEWVEPPYVQAVSKKPTVEIRNIFGGISTIQLDSLAEEAKVEDRFKGRRYSMIYMPELSTFHSLMTFATLTESLRMLGLPDEKHLFLADSNPPDDESWWMHDLWWDLLELPYDEIDNYIREKKILLTADDLKVYKDGLARIDITVEENPFADPKHVQLLRAKYSHNQELYRRYILGECVRTTSDSLFVEVFRPEFHVVGEVVTASNKDPEMMFPEEDCVELLTGWDPGSTTNWAAHVIEKFYPKWPGAAELYQGQPCFKILDETMVIGEDVDVHEFIGAHVEKMRFWEEACGRKVKWTHWSDNSVFSMRDLESAKYYAQIIFEISNGIVNLVGAEKSAGSLRAGMDLLRRLFWEDRIFINAAKCPVTIAALKGIKKGTSALAVVARGTPHKHPVDSLRYVLQSETYDEIGAAVRLNMRRRRDELRKHSAGGGSMVAVRM